MNTKDLKNKHIPDLIFNDASNRNTKEIDKLYELCIKNNKFLIYQKRNENNEHMFKEYELFFNIDNLRESFMNGESQFVFDIERIVNEHNL